MKTVAKEKALERLEIAHWQIEAGKINTLGSTLYFALFNYMQSILGEAPEGRWKHIGILKFFLKICTEKNYLDKLTLRKISKIYEDLYQYRLKADYLDEDLTEKEKRELIFIYEVVKEVINNGKN
ncbi:hypothetical protein SULAZ_1169 [Sulfurihydrogenibium azorense Az-Fu1]|jgi:uncharacterized protein (UPF0332 family)|uniref:HEPN domain-containing protein n=1 Tax=Sulfurihydrogenibium azorense (strain DSM 15241 / OCM 825 / Az-Fu1) TaxID=204536 RepID=C1DVK3_SULAA|nr:HEPN domain-containing protein [Sulfurihydrogenibium azorense]ACN98930.1 hypothetical protein SULAZ_1169 [Sulfurihydrogenibium azorense Az-Fu1]MDM7274328.1 HEPN domain-containing protein [Sulfurihydrogenibium azorense]